MFDECLVRGSAQGPGSYAEGQKPRTEAFPHDRHARAHTITSVVSHSALLARWDVGSKQRRFVESAPRKRPSRRQSAELRDDKRDRHPTACAHGRPSSRVQTAEMCDSETTGLLVDRLAGGCMPPPHRVSPRATRRFARGAYARDARLHLETDPQVGGTRLARWGWTHLLHDPSALAVRALPVPRASVRAVTRRTSPLRSRRASPHRRR